jgi:hypothetical protein
MPSRDGWSERGFGAAVPTFRRGVSPRCRYVPGNNRERTSYSLFKSSRYLPLLVTFPTSSGVTADCDRSCTKVI